LTTALLVPMVACGGGGKDDTTAAPGSENAEETTTTGAGGGHFGDTINEAPDAAAAGLTYIATAKVPQVAVYAQAEGQETTHTLANPYPNGVPLVMLVDGPDTSGDRLRAYLPVKPNGSKGWVNANDVELTTNTYRVAIELTAHELTVTNGQDVVVQTPVGLGADGMETPQGTFFLKELLQPPNPNGDYGPYAYGLSAFTENPEVADDFGSDGVVGIHGTNDPASIGANSSHGCIRMANEVITQLADILPLGTPVQISA
jgi:lipoprotein-anchoring transpeptidase ErfK/SrfK